LRPGEAVQFVNQQVDLVFEIPPGPPFSKGGNALKVHHAQGGIPLNPPLKKGDLGGFPSHLNRLVLCLAHGKFRVDDFDLRPGEAVQFVNQQVDLVFEIPPGPPFSKGGNALKVHHAQGGMLFKSPFCKGGNALKVHHAADLTPFVVVSYARNYFSCHGLHLKELWLRCFENSKPKSVAS
ncbi:MAG: hypothetical protein ACE5FY_07115, partial [Nitrospiria bacterium]